MTHSEWIEDLINSYKQVNNKQQKKEMKEKEKKGYKKINYEEEK